DGLFWLIPTTVGEPDVVERNTTMIRLFLIVVLLVLLGGCQRKPALPAPDRQGAAPVADTSKDEPRAQVRIGENPEDWGLVPFDILKVYPKQKTIDAAPWHADGGDWMFFDCRTDPPRPASFTVGVRAKVSEGKPIAWGEATILVTEREEGVKLL